MKKQKSKGTKSGGAKKKEGKATTEATEAATELEVEGNARLADGKAAESTPESPVKENAESSGSAIPSANGDSKEASHGRRASASVQSKIRSASFRRGSLSQGPLSPSASEFRSNDPSVTSPDGDYITSVYRTQAARLEELEKENKRLGQEAESAVRKLRQTEEELDELREGSGHVAELRTRIQELESHTEELSSTVV